MTTSATRVYQSLSVYCPQSTRRLQRPILQLTDFDNHCKKGHFQWNEHCGQYSTEWCEVLLVKSPFWVMASASGLSGFGSKNFCKCWRTFTSLLVCVWVCSHYDTEDQRGQYIEVLLLCAQIYRFFMV